MYNVHDLLHAWHSALLQHDSSLKRHAHLPLSHLFVAELRHRPFVPMKRGLGTVFA